MVQHNPGMLDVPGLRAAMEEAARIMPQLDVQAQVLPPWRPQLLGRGGTGGGLTLAACGRQPAEPWLAGWLVRPCPHARCCRTHAPPRLPLQMGADPSMILGFQRGSQLIPYDPPRPTTPEEAAADDDEYGAYYGGGV